MKEIHINIWDDYGEGESTGIYVEELTFTLKKKEEILNFLKTKIPYETRLVKMKWLYSDTVNLKLEITISHKERENLVKYLNQLDLTFDNKKFKIYSES